MTTRTRVQMTYEETSPGVPLWGTNSVTTDIPLGQDEIAIENLVAGRIYYIKTWNEDQFGNRSPELTRVVKTPIPTRLTPVMFSASGVLDSGSPMYAFVKVPSDVLSVNECQVTLSFRQFMAPATAATSVAAETSGSGGSSTPTSGASSATSSGSSSSSTTNTDGFPYTIGSIEHVHSGGAYPTWDVGSGSAVTNIATTDHTHGMTHTHTIPHTHDVTIAAHDHTVPAHGHALTYGTFEETYPASHSVNVKTYKRVNETWVLQNTTTGLTGDLEDIDMTSVINTSGDWRIEVLSAAAQPNGGRLSCDLYGFMNVTV